MEKRKLRNQVFGFLLTVLVAGGATAVYRLWVWQPGSWNKVDQFFNEWENRQYVQMLDYVENYGDRGQFIAKMSGTPVRFRKPVIGKAVRVPETDDWLVGVSLEITDVASVLSSVIDAETRRLSGAAASVKTPAGSTKKYRMLHQELLVRCSESSTVNSCRIDLCREGTACRRRQNFVNYFLDAGTLADAPSDPPSEIPGLRESERRRRTEDWLERAMSNLGIPQDEAPSIMAEGMRLYEQSFPLPGKPGDLSGMNLKLPAPLPTAPKLK